MKCNQEESRFPQVSDLNQLKTGTIIKNRVTGSVFVVTANYGNRVTAVMTADITNPPEWLLVATGNKICTAKG